MLSSFQIATHFAIFHVLLVPLAIAHRFVVAGGPAIYLNGVVDFLHTADEAGMQPPQTERQTNSSTHTSLFMLVEKFEASIISHG